MIDRTALIQCFTDTQRMVQEDAELSRATLRMQAGTVLYFPGYAAIDPPHKSVDCPLPSLRTRHFTAPENLLGKDALPS